MASRLMSRSLISSARSTFQSGGNAFRAARGRPASSNTRPPSSSDRNPFRNNSTNFRRRCAETMIPLHDAVAGAKLISHLAVNSRSRSSLSLERCCRWIWRVFGSNRGVVSEGRERLRSKESTNECSFAASLEEAEVFKDFSAHIGAH
uniref:Uncharacterized protein n=1 Tax=Picea sitchensis TaxID=3332 RepID=A9NRT5_PICSI|nr:unknown [Picea sitchensis]